MQIEEEKEEEKIPFKPNYNLNKKDDDLDSLPDVDEEFNTMENKPLNVLMESRNFKTKNPMQEMNVVAKEQQRQLQPIIKNDVPPINVPV